MIKPDGHAPCVRIQSLAFGEIHDSVRDLAQRVFAVVDEAGALAEIVHAQRAGKAGGSLPTVFNAANELAVSKFLNRKIKYLEIPEIIEICMRNHKNIDNPTVEEILQTEQEVYEQIESRW